MADVWLQLRSSSGELLLPRLVTSSIEWDLEENTFGVLHASGPLADIDPKFFAVDARFEIMRQIQGLPPYVEGETQFILRWWDHGEYDWRIEAYSLDELARGRVIDYYASTDNDSNPYTHKENQADDMQKVFVAENLGSSATLAARRLSELIVAANLAAAPEVEKSCAYQKLFDVLQDLSEDSIANGTWLSWGIVASGTGTGFEFTTWTGQRGKDHTKGTGDEVIVSKAMGNLADPRISFDHRQEVTAVRALGLGEGQSRVTARVEDTTRSAASPLAYREKVIQGIQTTDTGVLTAKARTELRRSRPMRGFTGAFLDTDYARYGQRVKFGDLVTAEFGGYSFTCRLWKVSGKYDGAETLTINLDGSDYL